MWVLTKHDNLDYTLKDLIALLRALANIIAEGKVVQRVACVLLACDLLETALILHDCIGITQNALCRAIGLERQAPSDLEYQFFIA